MKRAHDRVADVVRDRQRHVPVLAAWCLSVVLLGGCTGRVQTPTTEGSARKVEFLGVLRGLEETSGPSVPTPATPHTATLFFTRDERLHVDPDLLDGPESSCPLLDSLFAGTLAVKEAPRSNWCLLAAGLDADGQVEWLTSLGHRTSEGGVVDLSIDRVVRHGDGRAAVVRSWDGEDLLLPLASTVTLEAACRHERDIEVGGVTLPPSAAYGATVDLDAVQITHIDCRRED